MNEYIDISEVRALLYSIGASILVIQYLLLYFKIDEYDFKCKLELLLYIIPFGVLFVWIFKAVYIVVDYWSNFDK